MVCYRYWTWLVSGALALLITCGPDLVIKELAKYDQIIEQLFDHSKTVVQVIWNENT
jgi:hypothetical protein